MGKTKTTGKHRLDKYYYLAKEQGYRSRAAFKLVQLDRKFRFLSTSRSVLDLCAAPGGWMQVAVKHMPVGSLIIGVDLVPIRPIRGALSLQEDITTPKCMAALKKLMGERGHNLVDVILHDGSPNVGGAWSKEALTQSALVLDAMKLATKFLAPKGTFVTKVFRSQDYNSLLYALKQLFEKVEVTKPVASRSTSAEIYVIGLKYKAPGKIDPRLLDLRHLFQEIAEPSKSADVLRTSKQKRHREGYEEDTTFRKVVQARDFVWADKPLEMLGAITSIAFEGTENSSVRDHPLTTDEIKLLCQDLQLLGKKEFKQLLKWRLQIRKLLSSAEDIAIKPTKAGGKSPDEEEEDMLAKMEELKSHIEARKKKEKKMLAKRRQKLKARTATGMQLDVLGDTYSDADLFSLTTIKAKELDRVENAGNFDDEVNDSSSDEMLNGTVKNEDGKESDMDSDVERERYDAELENYLDQAYSRYWTTKSSGSAKRRKRARLGAEDGELWQESNLTGEESEKLDDQSDGASEDGNPLIVSLTDDTKPSREQLAKQWFSQDIFAGLENEESKGDEGNSPEETVKAPALRKDTAKRDDAKKLEKINLSATTNIGNQQPEDDFEVVPMEGSSSSDESSAEDYDSDDKAEILAYAKKMLRKKSREEIIDNAYNRYMFDDQNLPEWFADDERKHSQPQKPITKEDIMAMKSQFRAIDARPVKKVAEAKARKKRRAMKKMEQVRQKATTIADQSDLSSRSKNKLMERLYKNAANPKKAKRELVVAKKGVSVRGGRNRVVVDRRMKKDSRSRGDGKPGRHGGKTGGGDKKGKKGFKVKAKTGRGKPSGSSMHKGKGKPSGKGKRKS